VTLPGWLRRPAQVTPRPRGRMRRREVVSMLRRAARAAFGPGVPKSWKAQRVVTLAQAARGWKAWQKIAAKGA